MPETREKIEAARKRYIPSEVTVQRLKDAWVRRKARAALQAHPEEVVG